MLSPAAATILLHDTAFNGHVKTYDSVLKNCSDRDYWCVCCELPISPGMRYRMTDEGKAHKECSETNEQEHDE